MSFRFFDYDCTLFTENSLLGCYSVLENPFDCTKRIDGISLPIYRFYQTALFAPGQAVSGCIKSAA